MSKDIKTNMCEAHEALLIKGLLDGNTPSSTTASTSEPSEQLTLDNLVEALNLSPHPMMVWHPDKPYVAMNQEMYHDIQRLLVDLDRAWLRPQTPHEYFRPKQVRITYLVPHNMLFLCEEEPDTEAGREIIINALMSAIERSREYHDLRFGLSPLFNEELIRWRGTLSQITNDYCE